MILQCKDISKSFGKVKVLKSISLHVKKGEILTLLGDSGCGKSTLLRILAGLEKSDGGEVNINDTLVADKDYFIPPQKRKIAFVFQDYALFPHMNVNQNIAFALKDVPKNEQKTPIEEISKILNIVPLLEKNPHELSGGQQQRIAIARALVLKPQLLLLDEPFSNLDTNLKQSVSLELREIIKSLNIGAIMVTHNRSEALSMSDNIAILHNGFIEQLDNPITIYNHPKTLHAGNFMGEISTIKKDKKIFATRPEWCSFSFTEGRYKVKIKNIIFEGYHNILHANIMQTNEVIKVYVNGDFKVCVGDIGFVDVEKIIELDM